MRKRRPGGVRWGLGRRPLPKHRNSSDDIETEVWCEPWDEPGGSPPTGQAVSGVEGGVSPVCCSRAEREESAGMNRHEERDENARHRRSSDPRWPQVMRWRPARAQRSVDRGTCRPAMEPRNHHFGVPTSSHEAEGHTTGGASASRPVGPARSENLRMHGVLMRENREVPCSPVQLIAGRAAQGTPRR